MEKTFDIFHYDKARSDRPFVGISEDGHIEFFDSNGKDEWFECGGHWYALDLTTKQPASVKLDFR